MAPFNGQELLRPVSLHEKSTDRMLLLSIPDPDVGCSDLSSATNTFIQSPKERLSLPSPPNMMVLERANLNEGRGLKSRRIPVNFVWGKSLSFSSSVTKRVGFSGPSLLRNQGRRKGLCEVSLIISKGVALLVRSSPP